MIIPSIDILDGKAVKLIQGKKEKKRYEEDPLALALEYSIYPEINLIDLDAAFGQKDNLELIKKISKICRCNVGGGIRTEKKAWEILKLGAEKIIIGTRADKKFLKNLPKQKVIVALDSKKGKVVGRGWTKKTKKTPLEKAKELKDYCSGFLYTYVDKEGMMQGIDIRAVKELKKITDNKIIYAGGISKIEEIKQLEELDADSVLGMSLYTKKIDLNKAFISILDFKKNKGLIPTIVQEKDGQVLMLAYSSRESLKKAIETRQGWYYSRSRNKLWRKGETSENTQNLIRIRTDCDKDTLLFTVKQKNYACHTGKYSCFDDEKFNIISLQEIIRKRKKNPRKNSLTNKLLNNEYFLKQKISEEAQEVINYKNKKNLVWEIADLIYFLLVIAEKKEISFSEVLKELEIRNLKNAGRQPYSQ
ncbi:bifunctional phosphoribosyl-AMP cyclohydrolase/phosphoribosyl-ATP diphosphatase HisIE [Candidatus Woesearchaeota archaeon]|nr:bifunctional phosphoribosyl-AMP cyclohydrolase/phosphoribosyl-ATP diphosphatase HisIE [Candidatus Woesearchaeota archaeon]